MAKKKGKKLQPGKGAKASILTRMIKPIQPVQGKDHRSDIVLVDQFVDDKGKKCFHFRYSLDGKNGPILHALAHWVKTVEEGDKEDFFEPSQQAHGDNNGESDIPWKDSVAKRMLYRDIRKGLVPKEARDEHNRSTMPLKDIYNMHPEEYHKYDYKKFSGRLSSLRKTVREKNLRAKDDQAAFDLFVTNHNVSMFSSKGYTQWQGSDAQKKAKKDIDDGKLEKGHPNYVGYRALFSEKREYHEHFPFPAFRDKMRQEIKTGKYLHTLKVKGKQHQSS